MCACRISDSSTGWGPRGVGGGGGVMPPTRFSAQVLIFGVLISFYVEIYSYSIHVLYMH